MHAIEKILAKNSGCSAVKAGEIVTAKIDFAEINDLYGIIPGQRLSLITMHRHRILKVRQIMGE